MNKQEIVQLISIATANFPNMQGKDMRATLTLWEKALNDIPYDVAEKALLKVLSTSKFFPTIADIRESATELTQPRIMDAMEAWGLITKAIKEHGYYDKENGMKSLPPDVAEMVRRFGWNELCTNTNPDTMRAQFRMAWESQSKRINEYQKLPSEIRQMIDGIANRMKMIE